MAFTIRDKQEVDALAEEYLCSNLSKWLDLDDIIEVAFEVQRNRKRIAKENSTKKRTQKK